MPTTRFKNTVYRAMLPFCAPTCSNSPVSSVSGRPLVARDRFVRGSITCLVRQRFFPTGMISL